MSTEPLGLILVARLLRAEAHPLGAFDERPGGDVVGRNRPEIDDRHVGRHMQAVGRAAVEQLAVGVAESDHIF